MSLYKYHPSPPTPPYILYMLHLTHPVIHIILSVSSCIADIPLLLARQTPLNAAFNPGSQNYTNSPVAIALGGGFSDEMFAQIREGCRDAASTLWLRVDASQVTGPPKPEEVEMYGKKTAERLKKRLGELRVGQEEGTKEGVFWF